MGSYVNRMRVQDGKTDKIRERESEIASGWMKPSRYKFCSLFLSRLPVRSPPERMKSEVTVATMAVCLCLCHKHNRKRCV